MMILLKLSVVVVVGMLVLLAGSGEGRPGGPDAWQHWDQWKELQQQNRQQEQARQEQMLISQAGRRPGSTILDARQQQLLREILLEEEQERREEMEEIIGSSDLDEFSLQLKIDTLGRILQPLLHKTPSQPVNEDCVTRRTPVAFMEMGLWGHFAYTVCGSGDGAAMHIHFQKHGATTPSLDTTTPVEATTTPTQPLCPTVPTPSPTTTDTPSETPAEPETTTSEEADLATTTAADGQQQ